VGRRDISTRRTLQVITFQGASVLDVETYDAAERAAADKYSNRILQAFYPEMFAALGYPARVERTDQLWRYIDVMHETRTRFNMEHLLQGLTQDEFELFKRVTKIVDEHATKRFHMRAQPTAALLRAIHALRLIKIVTGRRRPAVLEVGPGCGYLAMLLVLEGYPYIGTEVVQAFYLYQSQMLAQVAKDFRELVSQDDDILSIQQPQPGTAIHIPWWKWVSLTPDKVRLGAGVITANHVMCEMHPSSLAYFAMVGRRILSNNPGGGCLVFEHWGHNALHSPTMVAQKFSEHGMTVCHDEPVMSAMVLTENAGQWLGKVGPLASGVREGPHHVVLRTERSAFRRGVKGLIRRTPPLKRMAITAWHLWNQIRPLTQAEVNRSVDASDVHHPLSRQLRVGRAAAIAQATVHLPELEGYLASYFGGSVPQSADEVFFAMIGVQQQG
jgi:hypothetical protein